MCRLGLLAAALGDGTLCIWAVPHPRLVQQRYSTSAVCGSAPFNGLNPPVVDVPPVAVISSRDLGGSMPSVMDWLPAKPHDLLLVRPRLDPLPGPALSLLRDDGGCCAVRRADAVPRCAVLTSVPLLCCAGVWCCASH